jgi:hypothetical protein
MDAMNFLVDEACFTQETPRELTPVIAEALRRISTASPFFIDVTPMEGARPRNCYHNVDACIAVAGGSRDEGWIVYEGWGGRFLVLVHHCVWRRPDGSPMDVTPPFDGFARYLFLPDVVHFVGRPIPARFLVLEPGPEVYEVVRLAKEGDRLFRRVACDGWQDNVPCGRNDPCPCGSGRKFKHCCKDS